MLRVGELIQVDAVDIWVRLQLGLRNNDLGRRKRVTNRAREQQASH